MAKSKKVQTHFVKDEKSKAVIAAGEATDEHIQGIQDEIALKRVCEVKSFDNSPTNFHRQWGAALATVEFEKKLVPILPSFVKLLEDPRVATLRHAYLVKPDGEKEHLLAYPAPMIPENTVCYTVYEDIPDLTVRHIQRGDCPPATFNKETGTWDFDTSTQPLAGMRRVALMDRIALKGWRQVLVQLVWYGVITPHQAETTFGASDRAEWGHKMGKIHAPTSW